MNRLKSDCFIGHDTSILLYKFVNIPIFALVAGKLIFDLYKSETGWAASEQNGNP